MNNVVCLAQGHLDTMKRSLRRLRTQVRHAFVTDTDPCCNVLCCLPLSQSQPANAKARKSKPQPAPAQHIRRPASHHRYRPKTMSASDPETLTRVLLVGSRGIGKTSLARTIADGAIPSPDNLSHTIDENEAVFMKYKTIPETAFTFGDCKQSYDIELKEVITLDKDTAPKWEDIKGSHVVFFCFDITNTVSFEAVRVFYFPKVVKESHGKKNRPDFILVGLKEDAKNDIPRDVHPITPVVANKLAREIGATAYVETSALKHIGVDVLKEKCVFRHLMKSKQYHDKVKEDRCTIL